MKKHWACFIVFFNIKNKKQMQPKMFSWSSPCTLKAFKTQNNRPLPRKEAMQKSRSPPPTRSYYKASLWFTP